MNSTCLIRIPFDVTADPDQFGNLNLKDTRFDDGFVAFINGLEVASTNAPDDLAWNASSTEAQDDASAINLESFTISVKKRGHALHTAPDNQGLNNQDVSTDFLVSAMLEGVDSGGGSPVPMADSAMRYSDPVVLTQVVWFGPGR